MEQQDELQKNYDQSKETEIYSLWEKSGSFQPDLKIENSKIENSCFSMIMPPPNANGSLHIGHAVFVTLEDIMIRYHRMKGEPTLWLPGADHAGFETQVVYQKKLEKEGRNWFKIPREKLYQEIKEFTLKNKEHMEEQLRHLGASCDWTREKFTLDEDIIKIVYQTFKELYDDGLVYRDSRIINWCTKHQTTLSDLEIKHEDRQSELYEIKYGEITIATTRPETMFADVAVAVNPKDKRYKNLVGKTVKQPLADRELPIIADDLVDPEFGTGALKITPAHDAIDYEIGKKHQLSMDHRAFDFFGKLGGNWVPKKYHDLKVEDARAQIVEDLEKLNLLIKKPYKNAIAVCYKCNRIIEPMVLPQWFIAMTKKSKRIGKSLHELGIDAVKNGEVKFVTKKFEKIYLHWLSNLRDWNISRQIIWGIQMPVWYCQGKGYQATKVINPHYLMNPTSDCEPIVTDGEKPKSCKQCGSTDLVRDLDVFDTWFSSGQWTFAPLMTTNTNHPEKKEQERDFKTFYPTTVMETGHDILFFWVARMIMLGKYKTGKAPFKYVYLHGLVRDKDRQKMSKSKGNVIDPLGVIKEYGADALRMALVFGVSAGNDIVISEEKIKGMRNFSNKVWNIARFVISQVQNSNLKMQNDISNITNKTEADKEILDKLEKTEKSVEKDIEDFRFHEAAQTLYQFIWHDFADIYIEASKRQLNNKSLSHNTCFILHNTVKVSLKLLHPFMPFVTESIWQELARRSLVDSKDKLLITSKL